MSFWRETVIEKELSYKEADEWIKKLDSFSYISRQGYDEIHFYDKDYCILKSNGTIERNPENIPFKDKDDWLIVMPTHKAIKILMKKGILNKYKVLPRTNN